MWKKRKIPSAERKFGYSSDKSEFVSDDTSAQLPFKKQNEETRQVFIKFNVEDSVNFFEILFIGFDLF